MSSQADFIENLQKNITNSLMNAAKACYSQGMSLFHEVKGKDYLSYQPPVAMLCVAVELMLKSVIAKKAFRYLYTNIPTELQIMLSYPDCLPKSISPRLFAAELQSFSYSTVELNEAISFFYRFFPEIKHEYKPYFSLLSSVRNASLHGALPPFQRYDLERIGYISTKLYAFLGEQDFLKYYSLHMDTQTKAFMDGYKDERIQRVKDAIEAAKSASKKIEHYGSYCVGLNEWELFSVRCPVCESEGIATGDTDEIADPDGPGLVFVASDFTCDDCGLKLLDHEEMQLAGMQIAFERDGEIDRWMGEKWEDQYGYEDG